MIPEYPEEFEADTAGLNWWDKMDILDAMRKESMREAYGAMADYYWLDAEQELGRLDA